MHRRIAEVLWCWWISGSYFHTGPNTGIYSSPSFHPFPSDSNLPSAYFPPPPPDSPTPNSTASTSMPQQAGGDVSCRRARAELTVHCAARSCSSRGEGKRAGRGGRGGDLPDPRGHALCGQELKQQEEE